LKNYSSGYSITGTVPEDTTPENETTPPANVISLNAEAYLDSIGLSWTNPGDIDFIGVIIVKSSSLISWIPSDGNDYFLSSVVDTDNTIIYTGFVHERPILSK